MSARGWLCSAQCRGPGESSVALTREELAAEGLVPGGQPAVAWRRSPGAQPVALFARAAAVPARPSTLAELAEHAARARAGRSGHAASGAPRSLRRWRCAARAA